MPHFKDQTDRLYFLSDEDIANGGISLLPSGSQQISDEQAEVMAAQPNLNTAPQTVTRRQALLALLAAEKLDQVDLLIQNAPRAVQIAWEAAGTFERTNPLIESLAPQLGLTEADIDNLFIAAAKL